MTDLRYAAEGDINAVKRLWTEAFGDDEPYTGWYFHNIWRSGRTLCLFEAAELAACVQFAPYRMQLGEREIPVAYVVGLCTAPPHQHKGYARRLLERLDEDLRSDCKALLLYTDIPGFYRPLGFCTCYHLKRVRIPARFDAQQLSIWQAGTLAYPDLDRYAAIYRQMTTGLDGFLLRDYAGWLTFFGDFLCDNGALYLCDDAYLLWCYDDDGGARVKEIGYANERALAKSLRLAAHLAAARELDSVIWDAPLTAPVPEGMTEKTLPYVMARLTGKNSGETAAFFGSSPSLWINEMT